ncbi:hypothetical protein EON65_52115 [archaeon]|nr:MAG: hypothetical protein EON65_52115 [archaeon]
MKRPAEESKTSSDKAVSTGGGGSEAKRPKSSHDAPWDLKSFLQEGKAEAEREYKDLLEKYLEFIKLLRAEFGDAFAIIVDCLFLLLQVFCEAIFKTVLYLYVTQLSKLH